MRLRSLLKRETNGENGALQPAISDFWTQLQTNGVVWTPRLIDRVWVVNRCLQLCAQQIASMPLRFFGTYQPGWVANPDPVWYPNGIGDATFAAAWSMYGYGDAFLYITDVYSNGYAAQWTVLDPVPMSVNVEDGRRVYKSGNDPLDADRVVQISRDPRGGLRGTSALASYAGQAWGMLGASELGRSLVGGTGVPNAVLKSKRRLTPEQATTIQESWVNARARAPIGSPAVLPPEIDFEQLSFNVADLALLDVLQYDTRAIASAFSVPAFMLNMPLEGGLTYQNPETLFEVWWRTELRPAAGRLQRAYSSQMLPAGNWVEYDARAALAPTFAGQVTSWLALQGAGVVTIDEVRAAILHLPPLEQGEALDELAEPPSAAASPSNEGTTPANVQELRPTVVSSV